MEILFLAEAVVPRNFSEINNTKNELLKYPSALNIALA